MSDYEAIARQILRALRGKRSQAALSRRLGFRSNVAAKWESGQRMPSAEEVVTYAQKLGNDPVPAFAAFNPNAAAALGSSETPQLGPWLNALRGTQLIADVAERSGLSRFSVGRFLAGGSQPRLPQFLALLDALTNRLEDLVDVWVGIAAVPALEARFVRSRAARDALFQRPLCLAVMCLLDTRALNLPEAEQRSKLADTLEVSDTDVEECLQTLVGGGLLRIAGDRYRLSDAVTFDAHATPSLETAAKRYWTRVAHERVAAPTEDDVCSYNVFSISRSDYGRLKELQREFYRGARALIAASEPTDLAALFVVQLVQWDPTSNHARHSNTSEE